MQGAVLFLVSVFRIFALLLFHRLVCIALTCFFTIAALQISTLPSRQEGKGADLCGICD